jgi:hypothetical protein
VRPLAVGGPVESDGLQQLQSALQRVALRGEQRAGLRRVEPASACQQQQFIGEIKRVQCALQRLQRICGERVLGEDLGSQCGAAT